MRQVARHQLPQRVLAYLVRKQASIDAGQDYKTIWANARKTVTMRNVAQTLASMSGKRQRCMFCGDSRSTDIEHFWPKAVYQGEIFHWNNLLWICTGCNRQKGNRFGLDRRKRPLLIDPTAEDPWDFLFFDSSTGNLAPRYDSSTGRPSAKGTYSVDPTTLPLNIEAVTEGRQRIRRNLIRAVSNFLHRVPSSSLPALQAELLEAIQDNDDYGLAYWYFRRDGETEEPFRTLRQAYPPVWQSIIQSL